MSARQRIAPVRRDYNRWVANQTLEDYALRFTAKSARRFSSVRISQTAIGAISFLALEAIGGAITMSYGTLNAVAAILVVSLIFLVTGWPIARYASRYGVDIDLLTRGAGFGYIGSTITSLIYASFTFMLFAIEASIMSAALDMAFGVPLWIGYIVSAVVVIPLVTHGIMLISRFQLATQPVWIVLNILPFVFIAFSDWHQIARWTDFGGLSAPSGPALFDTMKFGAASAVILALIAQIGEQVDFLRFLPARGTGKRWYIALFLAGPGWVILGAPKMIAGSFLAVLALNSGVAANHAAEPAYMYGIAFQFVLPHEQAAFVLTAIFVVVSQLKINVMNAYAGSLAWSNFFSRLTHAHPGRVLWLVFNVAIALLLMELGIYEALERTLAVFSIIAVAWISTISADLLINKPLGLSPPGIEFKRAHLYDVNPVGTGAMGLAAALGLVAHFGVLGPTAESLAPFFALGVAFVAAPLIAWATGGKYYLARKPRRGWQSETTLVCSVCEHPFEPEDMAYCPAYAAPICSLCCSLDARCHDSCKPKAHIRHQVGVVTAKVLPEAVVAKLNTRLGRYGLVFSLSMAMIGFILAMIYRQATDLHGDTTGLVGETLVVVFFVFLVITGVVTWFFVLAQDSRRVAEEEEARQTTLLLREIAAHKKTDAALQNAKEVAEAANRAKSRYVVGLSHELRTPLNAVLGYAQVLERDATIPPARQQSVRVIRRSAEHLAGLIDGLLDISKIETGRFQVYSNEINIHEFLNQIADMFRLQAQARGLEFRHERAANLPLVVRTDEARLRQILLNLLSNAFKFTTEGAVSLVVLYRGQVATFVVEDTGPGVAADDLAHIFEPFVRGSAHAANGVAGLGLGLTITKLLAETLGGDIMVSSTPGVGSRFTVRLMLSAVTTPQALPAADSGISGYLGPRRTILVVDDNADHLELMRELLLPLDFTVLTADDGPACLDLVEGISPDLFFVDISMPGMNGWKLVDILRGRGVTAPILMLSANIGDGATVSADRGHNDLVAKPFDLRQLLDKMQKYLNLVWVEGNAEPPRPAPPQPPPAGPQPGVSRIQVRELAGFSEIGYVRAIEAKLAELARDPACLPLVEALRDRVRAFDFPGFNRILETVIVDD
jgi:signal transduction histidine kinase/CheY-like chemotaxis protein